MHRTLLAPPRPAPSPASRNRSARTAVVRVAELAEKSCGCSLSVLCGRRGRNRMPAGVSWACLGVPIDSVGSPDGGPPFGTELAPSALRDRDIVARLGAADRGDADVRVTGSARDPVSGIVGWPSVGSMTTRVRAAVGQVISGGERPFLLGGCCALVMGAVAGATDTLGRIGLVSVDGHLDLYDHRTSPTGEAADMPAAALLGLGWPDLLAALGPA